MTDKTHSPPPLNEAVETQIRSLINDNDVVLFMKGSAMMPMCGFSSLAVDILESLKVTFKDVDVLQSADLRQGIKIFSDWPTIPQLYVKGEFVGGSDILRSMHQQDELRPFFKEKGVACEDAAPS
ncbi:MAG: Grx4 family monothiol glutaredoxin [Alphaproteobacteria bacterium GM7ARS4]|nr:Grx4 family monothiol glutaredoxin [Alphaproteobacteria bacterium GM7ARS4]